MKIYHIVMNMNEASGVVTFVRRLADTIKDSGVESEILVESSGDLLPETIDADVVHIHGLWRPIFHRMCMKAFEQEVPVVWSPHGMIAPWAMKHKRLKKLVAWWLYQKWDLKCAALIHVTSEQEALWVRDLGIKQPIVVAPLGADLPKANESVGGRSEVERRNGKVLLFVGRVYPVKALDRLICAFAQVVGSRSEVVGNRWLLRIVGPDEAGHMSELNQLCEKLGLFYTNQDGNIQCSTSNLHHPTCSQVQFAGPKYGPDLEVEYENCDCLALVSHTENFGATVVDALAHHKPVITSTFTPWKIVQDEQCGWWVDNSPESLAAALRQLMDMTDVERAEMGARGLRLVEEKYTWGAVAEIMISKYKEICNGR